MRDISPKDATILTVIAQNSGMSVQRLDTFLKLADDPDEIRSEAEELVDAIRPPGHIMSEGAEGLREWVRGNRCGLRNRRSP